MNLNHRRQLIIAATLGPALGPVLMPAIALAQPTARPRRIGYLSLSKAGSPTAQTSWAMILDSLRRAGWQAGANLLIERRNAEGEVSRLDALAAELVGLNVELIIASLNAPIAAAKRATGTVPIVMLGANLPVELGFVQSLARPGGSVTGTAAPDPQTAMKAIEVLKEIAPGRRRLALLFNPNTPGVQALNAERGRAAQMLGMTVQTFAVTRAD